DLGDVWRAQTNTGTGWFRRRACVGPDHGIRLGIPGRARLGPRLGATPDHLVAGSSGHVDPSIFLSVAPGGSSTRRVGRLAVIFPRLGDSVALLGFELGLGSRASLAV